jgi:hypothetical protein
VRDKERALYHRRNNNLNLKLHRSRAERTSWVVLKLGFAGLGGLTGLGWVGLGWAGLGWAGLGLAEPWGGLGWAGLGWAGLGWVGLGWVGLEPCDRTC